MRLVLAYKNFSRETEISHIGLGISTLNISKSLIAEGYRSEIWPVFGGDELWSRLNAEEKKGDPVTHVVIAALFIPTAYVAKICMRFPQTKFAINCHSNVGFLQAEPQAIVMIREALELESGMPNFHIGGNSERFARAVSNAYGAPVISLPNLYYLGNSQTPTFPHLWRGGTLRIGAFGAGRIFKNFSSAVVAAIEIGRLLKAETELWVNAKRTDGAGNSVERTAIAWTKNVPGFKLRLYDWADWSKFRNLLATMHLLLQPSYTESFNLVTADAVAVGVPTVVSPAIYWVPEYWKAEPDDADNIARTGMHLITYSQSALDGLTAIQAHNEKSLEQWIKFLGPLLSNRNK